MAAMDVPPKTETFGIRTRPALNRLPLDTQVHILTFLDPKDIIAAVKTCKAISVVGHERIVWMHALRRVCVRHGVFAPSFEPMTDMSLPELKHAATSPMRLLTRFKRDLPTGSISRPCTRILAHAQGVKFDGILLAPGGRFLLTRTGNTIQLWDLGHSPKAIINPCPIASVFVEDGECKGMTGMQPTCDGLGLRVTIDILLGVGQWRFETYELYPLVAAPEFRHMGSLLLQTQYDINIYCVGGIFVALTGDTFTVWNFVEDSWVSWKWIPIEADHSLFICDGNLIVLDASALTVFKIPILHPRTPYTDAPMEILKPLFRLLHRDNSTAVIVTAASGWNPPVSSEARPFHFDVLCERDDDSGCVLDHYMLHPIDNTAGGLLPNHFPVRLHETPLPEVQCDYNTYLTSGWMGPDVKCCLWKANSSVMVKLLYLPSLDIPSTMQAACPIWTSPRGASPAHQFCFFSGRLCVQEHPDSSEIRVIDFLLP